jgi:hypothetical protein
VVQEQQVRVLQVVLAQTTQVLVSMVVAVVVELAQLELILEMA